MYCDVKGIGLRVCARTTHVQNFATKISITVLNKSEHNIFGKLGLGARHQSVSIQINENGNLKLTNYNQNEDKLVAERSATSPQRNRDGEGWFDTMKNSTQRITIKFTRFIPFSIVGFGKLNDFKYKNDTQH